MYRVDWLEQLKLGTAAPPRRHDAARVSPTVWTLGSTSLLTDVSSEMVYSSVAVLSLLLLTTGGGIGAALLCLFLFGLHCAATEGVPTAMASTMIPPESRTTGLAFVASCIGFGKMGSSLMVGWIWQVWGAQVAWSAFAAALAAVVLMTGAALSLGGARE